MAKFDIPKEPKLSNQVLLTLALLVVVAIVVALLTKLFIGFIIFLLGLIFTIGSQVTKDSPLDK